MVSSSSKITIRQNRSGDLSLSPVQGEGYGARLYSWIANILTGSQEIILTDKVARGLILDITSKKRKKDAAKIQKNLTVLTTALNEITPENSQLKTTIEKIHTLFSASNHKDDLDDTRLRSTAALLVKMNQLTSLRKNFFKEIYELFESISKNGAVQTEYIIHRKATALFKNLNDIWTQITKHEILLNGGEQEGLNLCKMYSSLLKIAVTYRTRGVVDVKNEITEIKGNFFKETSESLQSISDINRQKITTEIQEKSKILLDNLDQKYTLEWISNYIELAESGDKNALECLATYEALTHVAAQCEAGNIPASSEKHEAIYNSVLSLKKVQFSPVKLSNSQNDLLEKIAHIRHEMDTLVEAYYGLDETFLDRDIELKEEIKGLLKKRMSLIKELSFEEMKEIYEKSKEEGSDKEKEAIKNYLYLTTLYHDLEQSSYQIGSISQTTYHLWNNIFSLLSKTHITGFDHIDTEFRYLVDSQTKTKDPQERANDLARYLNQQPLTFEYKEERRDFYETLLGRDLKNKEGAPDETSIQNQYTIDAIRSNGLNTSESGNNTFKLIFKEGEQTPKEQVFSDETQYANNDVACEAVSGEFTKMFPDDVSLAFRLKCMTFMQQGAEERHEIWSRGLLTDVTMKDPYVTLGQMGEVGKTTATQRENAAPSIATQQQSSPTFDHKIEIQFSTDRKQANISYRRYRPLILIKDDKKKQIALLKIEMNMTIYDASLSDCPSDVWHMKETVSKL